MSHTPQMAVTGNWENKKQTIGFRENGRLWVFLKEEQTYIFGRYEFIHGNGIQVRWDTIVPEGFDPQVYGVSVCDDILAWVSPDGAVDEYKGVKFERRETR